MMFSIFGDLLMRGWEVRIPSLPGEVCCHFAVAHGAVAGGVIPVIMDGGRGAICKRGELGTHHHEADKPGRW